MIHTCIRAFICEYNFGVCRSCCKIFCWFCLERCRSAQGMSGHHEGPFTLSLLRIHTTGCHLGWRMVEGELIKKRNWFGGRGCYSYDILCHVVAQHGYLAPRLHRAFPLSIRSTQARVPGMLAGVTMRKQSRSMRMHALPARTYEGFLKFCSQNSTEECSVQSKLNHIG